MGARMMGGLQRWFVDGRLPFRSEREKGGTLVFLFLMRALIPS